MAAKEAADAVAKLQADRTAALKADAKRRARVQSEEKALWKHGELDKRLLAKAKARLEEEEEHVLNAKADEEYEALFAAELLAVNAETKKRSNKRR